MSRFADAPCVPADANGDVSSQSTAEVPVSIAMPRPARSGFRWGVLTLCFLIYLVAGADRANIGVVIPYMRKEFELSNTDIGAIASLFFFGYAIIQVPFSLLYQRYGVRWMFSFSLLATSVATLFMGYTGSALQLKVDRTALGVAEGPINIGILTVINRWFPPREKGTATGVFMASIKAAPALVPPICALIIYYFGWREVFSVFAVPGVVLAVAWLVLVNDTPRASRFCSDAEIDHIESKRPAPPVGTRASGRTKPMPRLDRLIRARVCEPLSSTRDVLGSWDIWACAVGYFFMVGIAYAIMTWVPTYLVNVKKYPLFAMGFVASTPWIGAVLGNVLGGVISDRLLGSRRKPMMLLTAASTIVTMFGLIYSPADPWLLALLFTATGILLNLGYSTFLVYPMGLTTREKTPLAAAIVNTGGSLGGAFAPFVVGVVLDWASWDAVFVFLASTSLLTLFVVLTMREPLAATSERAVKA
jgi:ACS family glucarate transporter-like MFS transporter